MEKYHRTEGRFLSRLADLVALVGGALILISALVIVFDIFVRNYGTPLILINEVDTITLAVVVSTFVVVGTIGQHFVSIAFLSKFLKNRRRPMTKAANFLGVLTPTSTFIFFVIFAWRIWDRVLLDQELEGATSVLGIATAPWWFTVAILFTICVPASLMVALRAYRELILGYAPTESEQGLDHSGLT